MSTAGIGVKEVTTDDSPEVRVDAQTHVGALFGVKLGGEHVVAGHDRGEVHPVLGVTEGDLGLSRISVVGVHEVEVAAARNVAQQGMIELEVDRVPADLRHLQAMVSSKTANGAGQDAKTLDPTALLATVEQQLKTHADTEEWPSRGGVRLEGFNEPARCQLAHAVLGGANAGQHQRLGPLDSARVAGDQWPLTDRLERSLHASQIPGVVVDDDDLRRH